MSASNIPTDLPCYNINFTFYNEKARFTAIVLFPTPPLHDDTAISFLTLVRPPFF